VAGYAEVEWPTALVETDRLLLRPWHAGDAAALRHARLDPALQRWFLPRLPSTDADADRWIAEDGQRLRRAGRGLQCAVAERSGGRLVGSVELRLETERPGTAGIELWVAPWARGQGYAAEVTEGISAWAFRHGTVRVELLAATVNEAAHRAALAGGFRREGQLRAAVPDGLARADAVLYGRLATDPPPPTPRALPDVGELSDRVVTVRRLRSGDEEALFDERVDPEAQRWATTARLWTTQDARAYVSATAALWLAGSEARFAIVDSASGTYAGSLGLRVTVAAFRVAEVGYGLRPAWRGRGLTVRALGLVSGWAFSAAGMARLELGTAVGNVASQRVAEQAGFRREGIAPGRLPTSNGGRTDEVRYGLVPPA
jgi:RimJ/RimL family protein N-acetyltransferase